MLGRGLLLRRRLLGLLGPQSHRLRVQPQSLVWQEQQRQSPLHLELGSLRIRNRLRRWVPQQELTAGSWSS